MRLPERSAVAECTAAVLVLCALLLMLPGVAAANSFLPPGFVWWGDWVDGLAVLGFGIVPAVFALLAIRQLRRISASSKSRQASDASGTPPVPTQPS